MSDRQGPPLATNIGLFLIVCSRPTVANEYSSQGYDRDDKTGILNQVFPCGSEFLIPDASVVRPRVKGCSASYWYSRMSTDPSGSPDSSLTCCPIGFMRTAMRYKFDAPHQPDGSAEREGWIELLPGRGFEEALGDLAGFSRVWLVWWFHRNTRWRARVLPPRGPAQRRGVFATRSPHRPNPIGLTAVPLLGVEGLKVRVGSNDLIDGTPILDIKPYLPSVDAYPEESIGWLAEIDAAEGEPRYRVVLEPLAEEQAEWLRTTGGVDFVTRARELLSRDPSPHRTRRIRRLASGGSMMACGGWRVYFSFDGQCVSIEHLASGYPDRILLDIERYPLVLDRTVHLEFRARWQPFVSGQPETEANGL